MKIIDYDISHCDHHVSLASKVKELIKEGWEPLGSSYVFEGVIHQPMVKYGKTEAEKAEALAAFRY